MTTEEAIIICEKMQLWRRGLGLDQMPYSSKEFGEALDTLIAVAKSTIN